MMRQARRSSAIKHDTVRCGFPSRRSYVAPSPRSRSAAKRPRKELTYCPTYGFKPFVIYTKDLTSALFCARDFTRSVEPCSAGALPTIPTCSAEPCPAEALPVKPHCRAWLGTTAKEEARNLSDCGLRCSFIAVGFAAYAAPTATRANAHQPTLHPLQHQTAAWPATPGR